MSILEGKIKSTIYYNEANNYLVALFRVSKTDEENKEYVKKTITITGNFLDLKLESLLTIKGEFTEHERFGKQFKVESYEYIIPSEKEAIIDFLSSPFIKGCGKKTAERIVEVYGDKSIDIIKENKFALDNIDGINESKRDKIYNSVINYSKSSDVIIKLKNLGFSIEEAGKIYTKYKDNIVDILDNNIYLLNEIVDFKRLDAIFLNNNDRFDKRRVKACILESMKTISSNLGDIYYSEDYIYEILLKLFNLSIDYDLYIEYLRELEDELLIVKYDNNYYLQENYQNEIDIAELLYKIANKNIKSKDRKKSNSS